MSLDVYLDLDEETTSPADRLLAIADRLRNPGSGIYVRRDGQTVEISLDEWHELYPGRDPVVMTVPRESGRVFEGNITHNLTGMARACGLYEALWEPDEHGYRHAADLVEPLDEGLRKLRSDPDHYRTFDPPNGWGDYDLLERFTAEYLDACKRWPTATVRVWR